MGMNADRRTDIEEETKLNLIGERGRRTASLEAMEEQDADRRMSNSTQFASEDSWRDIKRQGKGRNSQKSAKQNDMRTRLNNKAQNTEEEALSPGTGESHVAATEPSAGRDSNQASPKVTAYLVSEYLLSTENFAVIDNQLHQYEPLSGQWSILQESEANRALRAALAHSFSESVNKHLLYEVYEWLLQLAPQIETDMVKQKYLINFTDCAINWKTGEIIRDKKDLYFRYALHLRYDTLSERRTGAFNLFLKDVFGSDNKTMREFLKFLGLCLSSIRGLKYLFFLYGPSNSGKSVCLNMIKAVIGEEHCSSLSFTQMGNEFAITQLIGKRINLSGEVSGVSNKRLDIVKSLTGNDTTTACFKGKDHFQFKNEALLAFACNDFPPVQTVTELDSFLSRLVIFPFANPKPREEWIDDFEKVLLADAGTIIDEAINGLKALEEDSFRFCESPAMLDCKREFVGIYDSFALFAEEHIVESPNHKVSSEEIRDAYHTYCMNNRLTELADNIWSRLVKQRYQCTATTLTKYNLMGNVKRLRGYQGIKLVSPEDDPEDHELIVQRRV